MTRCSKQEVALYQRDRRVMAVPGRTDNTSWVVLFLSTRNMRLMMLIMTMHGSTKWRLEIKDEDDWALKVGAIGWG